MFRTLDTFDTEYSADSVEWCPVDSFKNIFVCGTYQLQKNEGSDSSHSSKRLGRIYVFEVQKSQRLGMLQSLEVPAVLDMKWAHVRCQNKVLLGVVNCLGYLQIYQITCNNGKKSLEVLTEKKVKDDDEGEVLALSLDWCTGKFTHDNELSSKIVVSDSKGFISLFEINGNKLNRISSWLGHSYEAWIAAFDYWDTNIIYSGGDDSKLLRFDTRIGSCVTALNKIHFAGVTSIHSNASREFLLSSGSYDETLRLWDTRNLKGPISEKNLGGGVWRLKWDPFVRRYLLAACMYGGFKIINCEQTENPRIFSQYNEHESIAYGCDWCFLDSIQISEEILNEKVPNAFLMGTCSFYDHVLKVSAASFDVN